jgi:hypothetical protein
LNIWLKPTKKEAILKRTTKKTIFTLYIGYFLFLTCISYGHGFGPDTLVELSTSSHRTIHALCLEALHNTISILTYDMQNSCICNQDIKIGKKSKSNCYIKLGFGKQFNISEDILCTPSQEFYVPAMEQWLPAYEIQPGNGLTASNGTIQQVTYKEFVPKSHRVYMLEIEKTHIFFVSKYSILTHNIFLPAAAFVGVSVPFGSVAATAIGSFFGTIGMVAGFTLGGLVGVAIKTIYENQVHRYKTPYYDNILFKIVVVLFRRKTVNLTDVLNQD